jgi:hypothetical protein
VIEATLWAEIETKNNLMKFHQVVYTGGPDGLRTRDLNRSQIIKGKIIKAGIV